MESNSDDYQVTKKQNLRYSEKKSLKKLKQLKKLKLKTD